MNPYDRKTQRQQWTAWAAGFEAGRTADTEISPAEIGKMIVARRTERKMSQKELAATLKVSQPTLWSWENGIHRPRGKRIHDLAGALSVAPEYFSKGAEQ